MSNKRVSEGDINIIRKFLGDDIVSEFLAFFQAMEKPTGMNMNPYMYEKEYTVDVSNFKERDLIGWLEYNDDFYDDQYFWKPRWFENLERLCQSNYGSKYVVVFRGIENASESVYNALKRFKYTGRLFDKNYPCDLPKNARFGNFELPIKVSTSNNNNTGKVKPENYCSGINYDEYDVLK